MADALPPYKRRALEQRRALLLEEYQAVVAQMGYELNPGSKVRLQLQADALEAEIAGVERQLGLRAGQAEGFDPRLAPPDPAHPGRAGTLLKLQLRCGSAGMLQVRGLQVPGGGEPKADVPLPFTFEQLKAVLKALDAGALIAGRFKSEQVRALADLGLLHDGRLHAEFHKRVGRALYDALFAGPIQTQLAMARLNPPVACQVSFDPEDTLLAQFPWELLHDGALHPVAAQGELELTRYIAFQDPPAPLGASSPLNMLYVAPRGRGEAALPAGQELEAVARGLDPLRQSGKLTWSLLTPPTWAALERALNSQVYHIIHFDGHGSFARVCPVPDCGRPHYPEVARCTGCGADMQDAPPKGYLHFETGAGHVDRVPVDELTLLFRNSETRLVVLSSCSSAVVEGVSVFNGVAPGLIQAGVPAVLGMQGSPTVEAAASFFERIYAMLAEGRRLPDAVSSGRRAIFRSAPPAWFMPVVYLRSSDTSQGQLFTP